MRKVRKIWCVTFKIRTTNSDFRLFWPKKANFWPFSAKKGPILNFRWKSETVTFLHLWNQGFMRKIRKIWCGVFSEFVNPRTDKRTDGRESIGPEDSRILETKNSSFHDYIVIWGITRLYDTFSDLGFVNVKKWQFRFFTENSKLALFWP